MFFVGTIATVALIVAIAAWRKAVVAQHDVDALRVDHDALRRQSRAGVPPAVERASAPAPSPPTPKPERSAGVPPAVERASAPAPPPPTPRPAPVVAKAPLPPPPRRDAAPTAAEDGGATSRPAPPPPPPPRPPKKPPFDWEALIGVKLFSWIGGVALVLAAIFFLSYSVQHGWIKPWLRASIGLATGTALIAVCEMRMARGYKLTADALDGAGIAILYATLFASHALWHLASAAVVFGAMLVVTALAVALSIRRDSVFIALLGLLGGFATPALLSTGENKPIVLFTYLLLLNIGLAWVAMTKR